MVEFIFVLDYFVRLLYEIICHLNTASSTSILISNGCIKKAAGITEF